MRWPWKRRGCSAAFEEARAAREQAERELEHTRAQTPKYEAIGRAVREVVETNHLSEKLTHAFRSTR